MLILAAIADEEMTFREAAQYHCCTVHLQLQTDAWRYRIKYRILYSIALYFSVINSESWDDIPPEVFSDAKSIFFCSYFIVIVIGSE